MLVEATIRFLEGWKKIWIEKQSKGKEVKSDKLNKLKEEADQRYDYKDWLTKACKYARPSLTSHPSTFTHSDAKTTALRCTSAQQSDGLLRTGNVDLNQEFDVFGNAASDTIVWETGIFLNFKVSDGKTVFEHFKDETQASKDLLLSIVDYEKARKNFLIMFNKTPSTLTTSRFLKQVYFPIDGDYHLLSVLTPSLILHEAKRRIDIARYSDVAKTAREQRKTGRYDNNGFDDFYDLTVLGLGGTKPQNVSVLNSQNAGKFYLLPSIPPILQKRDIRLPTRDFFRNSLRIRSVQDSFQSLHNLMICPVNNVNIRDGIQNILRYVIDQVLKSALKIRELGENWSGSEHYQSLPKSQKIWLDDVFKEQRESEEEWIDEISRDFSRWIIRAYETSLKQKSIKLSDGELKQISQLVEGAIKEDRESFR